METACASFFHRMKNIIRFEQLTLARLSSDTVKVSVSLKASTCVVALGVFVFLRFLSSSHHNCRSFPKTEAASLSFNL
jgi:hypothetical protein